LPEGFDVARIARASTSPWRSTDAAFFDRTFFYDNMSPLIDDNAFSLEATFEGKFLHAKGNKAGNGTSSYSTLLQEPIAAMVGNVPERSDAVSSAILGYN